MTPIITALMGIFTATAAVPGQALWAASAPTQAQIIHAPSYEVSMTAYNAVPGQTDDDPFTTASGAYSNPEIVAARSQDLAEELPFGTVILIQPTDTSDPNCGFPVVAEKVGLRVVADVMNARMKQKVDLLFDTEDMVTVGGREVNAARAFGICSNVKITVVGKIDMKKVPKTQNELAQMISGSGPVLAVAK